jgi:hypothetical protein
MDKNIHIKNIYLVHAPIASVSTIDHLFDVGAASDDDEDPLLELRASWLATIWVCLARGPLLETVRRERPTTVGTLIEMVTSGYYFKP